MEKRDGELIMKENIKNQSIKKNNYDSLEFIQLCCNSIKNHLKRKKTMNYDWESSIIEDIMEIETEVESGKKINKN